MARTSFVSIVLVLGILSVQSFIPFTAYPSSALPLPTTGQPTTGLQPGSLPQPASQQPAAKPTLPNSTTTLSNLRAQSPLFVANTGQWPDEVRFQAEAGPGTWWFTDEGIWLTVLRAADAQKDADLRSLSGPLAKSMRSA